MSTAPSEAHRSLVAMTLRTFELIGIESAAKLIADSEARAVEAAFPDSEDDSLYNVRRLRAELKAAQSMQSLAVRKLDVAEQSLTASRERVRVLEEALAQIVAYGNGRGDGCCPYGCDTPTIAHLALAATAEKEGSK